MNQPSYLERVIQYHSEKVKLYQHVNKNFLYAILEFQQAYSDLFTEKEYGKILHYCFEQTSSVNTFFTLLEQQLVDSGEIKMRRMAALKEQQQVEKEKERESKFKQLEQTKKVKTNSPTTNQATEKANPEPESKWGKRFSDLESKLKEKRIQQKSAMGKQTPHSPRFVVPYDTNTKKTIKSHTTMDEKRMRTVENVVKSLYEQGSYSLDKIAKMARVDIEMVKQILKR